MQNTSVLKPDFLTSTCTIEPLGSGALQETALDNQDNWQKAQERVLLYLKMLGMPPIVSVEIAREILKTGHCDAEHGNRCPPVQRVMTLLHEKLSSEQHLLEKTTYGRHPLLFRPWSHLDPSAPRRSQETIDASVEPVAVPPFKRRTMPAKAFQRLLPGRSGSSR